MGYGLTRGGPGAKDGNEGQAEKAPTRKPGLAFPGFWPLVAR